MTIQEILERISAKVGTEMPEVSSLIAEAKRESQVNYEDYLAVCKENKARRLNERELESKLETKDAEILKLSNSDTKGEIERLRKIESEYQTKLKADEDTLRASWEERAKIFELPTTDKRYAQIQKIRTDFAFAEENAPLGIDAIKNNMRLADTLTKAGVFDEPNPAPAQFTPPRTPDNIAVAKTSGEAILNLLPKS